MSLAIICPGKNPEAWIKVIKQHKPELEIQVYPNISAPDKVEVAMVWQHPSGILSEFKNLKMVSSMGAGVDHILTDESISKDLPIVRIVDEKLTWSMTNYVVMGVLNFHRQIERYRQDQKKKVWDMSNPEIPVKVGVMGVGALGGDVVDKLQYLGFPVMGYGFSEKKNLGFPYYSKNQLHDFLKEINVLVCLLPLTADTENILNAELFEACNPGTFVVNVARGKHLVDEDLISALDSDHLAGALLDVYRKEPLPKDHPFWDHPKIQFTPHIASVTNPEAAAPQVVENINRMEQNLPLQNRVNRDKGY
ncbi:2-hydroxyacid dehydrogenase [Algoriphagus namhaensis]|uniref:2-hydroxyacid dehydrogenase n=1 Tax=Algoriphagus namhaensis TaxID=915353 RepID=A0ABV8AV41_9BACT